MAKENFLLKALPSDVRGRIASDLKTVSLPRGEILHRPGDPIRDLYFPLDSLVSVTVTMSNGNTAEAGVVGNRDVVGINAFMGGRETTQTEYVVQISGTAIRIDSTPLREEFDRNTELREVLQKYTQAFIAQLSQNVACNRLHYAKQRFARWLLEARDCIQSDKLNLTQVFIAEMLGVRRASITELIGKYEKMGAIQTSRGLINIVDRDRLQASSCECYEVLKEEYDRLLGIRNELRPPTARLANV